MKRGHARLPDASSARLDFVRIESIFVFEAWLLGSVVFVIFLAVLGRIVLVFGILIFGFADRIPFVGFIFRGVIFFFVVIFRLVVKVLFGPGVVADAVLEDPRGLTTTSVFRNGSSFMLRAG